MSEVEIASLSESGQIHLPKQVRSGFNAKDKFAVMRFGDNILLKKIELPDLKKELSMLMEASQNYARKKGISSQDVEEAIQRSRKK